MKLRPITLAIVTLLLLGLGFYLHGRSGTSAPDFPEREIVTSDSQIIIEIPAGASGSEIGILLFDNKVIKSSAAYFRVAVGDKRSQKVSPGAHRLTQRISATQALGQLLDNERIPNLIKIFEGERKSEIVNSLLQFGFSNSEVSKAFKSIVLPDGFKSAEGLLFPAQYSYIDGVSATDAIQSMIDRFKNEPTGSEILRATKDYSALSLLTIASIVQAEGRPRDFTKVARVIFNRLKISMPLQMDSTVHYIMDVRGDIYLNTKSTLIDSEYNTYRRYGLPPGPIGNPGAEAMKATLNPAVGEWLFFITVAPGDTRFTASNAEFLHWKLIYEKNRKAGLFK